MRFIERLPVITEVLPVGEGGDTLSLSYYLFDKPGGEGVMHYAHEIAYAYRSLVERTNILDVGTVRIFMGRRCEAEARPYFESIGLGSLVSVVNVPEGVQLSGYLPLLDHESVSHCRYRFHCDSDVWWLGEGQFDWVEFCHGLDEYGGGSVFGQEIKKPGWVYQINLSQHALERDVQREAELTVRQVFGVNAPHEFEKIAMMAPENLQEFEPLDCLGGWFVGVRAGSLASRMIKRFYRKHGNRLSDDEGFFACLFKKFERLDPVSVMQGNWDRRRDEIGQASLDSFESFEGVFVINVGTQAFYDEALADKREALVVRFGGDTGGDEVELAEDTGGDEVKSVSQPLVLTGFGEHIVGTYALDGSGREFPLLSHSEATHAPFLGFPSAFRPITDALVVRDVERPDVTVFFCLSYNSVYSSHDMHVYAKSMVYAYKSLIRHTNILECGRVFFLVDERVFPVVYWYAKHARLDSLLITFESNKQMCYNAYVPFFSSERVTESRYTFYMDVDMWWANLKDGEVFDYRAAADEMDTVGADLFGYGVPKSDGDLHNDLYKRCFAVDDDHAGELRQWMQEHFGRESPEVDRMGISGCHVAVRNNSGTVQLIGEFYDEVSHFIRDDEAFWAVFLARYPEVEVVGLELMVSGTGFSNAEYEHHEKAELVHVGTYMFEHFFNKPRAREFYEHFKA